MDPRLRGDDEIAKLAMLAKRFSSFSSFDILGEF